MNILLLGAGGQVGTELRRTLLPLGSVRALTRAEADLSDDQALRRAVRAAAPDLIVNAAAYTAVDRAESEESLARQVNAVAPGVLAEEAAEIGVWLIHFSTDYVFDGRKESAYVEEDGVNPVSVYGRTKREGEERVLASGCRAVVLRASWIYGLHGANFLLTMLRLARERDRLRVVADQTGGPTWSRWIAEMTAQIAGRLEPEKAGIYHLSAGGATTWHGFAEAILDEANARAGDVRATEVEAITTAEYPTPATRPASSVLSAEKLATTFGLHIAGWREQLSLCMEQWRP